MTELDVVIQQHFECAIEDPDESMRSIKVWAAVEGIQPLVNVIRKIVAADTVLRISEGWEPVDADTVHDLNAHIRGWLAGLEAGYRNAADDARHDL